MAFQGSTGLELIIESVVKTLELLRRFTFEHRGKYW
jgi:hypothetical protein